MEKISFSNYSRFCIIHIENKPNAFGSVLRTNSASISFRKEKKLGPKLKKELVDVLTLDGIVRVEAGYLEHLSEEQMDTFLTTEAGRLLSVIGLNIDNCVGNVIVKRLYSIYEGNLYHNYSIEYTKKIGNKSFLETRHVIKNMLGFNSSIEKLMEDIWNVIRENDGNATGTLIKAMDIMLNGETRPNKRYPNKIFRVKIKEITIPDYSAKVIPC